MAATAAGGFALAACGRSDTPARNDTRTMAAAIAAEAARPHTGRTVAASLTPGPVTIDLGGVTARTLAYGNAIPGPLIRANVGDELAVTVANRLDSPTSVHWHGIALRNDMDGVAPATPTIDAGRDFTYRFSAPNPGTYWAHPHVGLDAEFPGYRRSLQLWRHELRDDVFGPSAVTNLHYFVDVNVIFVGPTDPPELPLDTQSAFSRAPSTAVMVLCRTDPAADITVCQRVSTRIPVFWSSSRTRPPSPR
ncbi:hypothetical protein AN933_21930 [Mycobacterium intracellulare subsp. chimaera]|nr:hypothetical protein AN933_21930 [Mycobacterium intracellulare subsp. chimaera]